MPKEMMPRTAKKGRVVERKKGEREGGTHRCGVECRGAGRDAGTRYPDIQANTAVDIPRVALQPDSVIFEFWLRSEQLL